MANEHKTYELTVEPREATRKKAKHLRHKGMVPGVVYGHDVEAQSIQVPLRELERVYTHAGSTSLVDLKIGTDGGPRKVFIHEVQRDHVTHGLAHVDFMVVNMSEPVTASIPLVLVGESSAVEQKEGILLQGTDRVQVRALPNDLPPLIEVDISGLNQVDDALHVSDLNLGDKVEVLTHGDEMIAKIDQLRMQVEEAPAEEGEAAAEGAPEGVQPPGEEEGE